MSGVLNFLTKIFGNKYDSDINELKPIIENINAEVKSLSTLSNDELRDITRQLKLEIKENTLKNPPNAINITPTQIKEIKGLMYVLTTHAFSSSLFPRTI